MIMYSSSFRFSAKVLVFNGAQILIETWLHVNEVLRCKWRCGSSKWTLNVDEVQVFLFFEFALEPVQDPSV